jgi:ADP-ribosylglycohydrolase
MYFAAALSMAFVSTDIKHTLYDALDYIPTNSEFHKQITWALSYSDEITNYRDANQAVTSRFPGMSWVHSINNACLTVWGILLGIDSFEKGITTTVAMAYDNDCTAATVGSILGAYHGVDAIDKKWYEPWNNTALSYLHGIDSFNLEDVILRFFNIYQTFQSKNKKK